MKHLIHDGFPSFVYSSILSGLMAFAASGCSGNITAPPPAQTLSVGSFAPYVARFEQDSAKYSDSPVQVTNLIIQFGPMATSTERGLCTITGDETPVITVDEDFWNSIDEADRTSLIYHELGHCVLRRIHNPTVANDGIPESVMYPYTLTDSVFEDNEANYLTELFATRNQF